MPPIADDAYVLRHWPYSETSQTVSLFARTHGVLRGLAKGARREKGSFSGGFETLDLGQIVAITKPNSDLAILTEWDLTRRPLSIYRDLAAHHAALYIADLIYHTCSDSDPHTELWDAMDRAVRALDERRSDPMSIVLGFQWATLDQTGHRPDLGAPDDKGDDASVFGYDPAAGRLLPDPGPDPSGPEVWRIRASTIELLRGVESNRTPEQGESTQDEEALARANLFLASCIRWFLGRELPTMAALFDQS